MDFIEASPDVLWDRQLRTQDQPGARATYTKAAVASSVLVAPNSSRSCEIWSCEATWQMSSKYPLTDAVRGIVYEGLSLEETFTQIYATEAWGRGSGAGSVPVHCLKWIEFVRTFIKENSIQSVVDLGCGDWQFSPYIYHDLGVDYVGYDVVLPVIQESLDHHLSSMIAQLRIMILLTIGAAIQRMVSDVRRRARREGCADPLLSPKRKGESTDEHVPSFLAWDAERVRLRSDGLSRKEVFETG
eukprot:g16608.t1